ncbi:caffeoylshikimate esterase [Phtheirospermum japonicum]|uniref:Caffeoylshikimate esterase n=1 Tax=Phtheirospermum japonicum TaxID=374723 RepID=A0A830BGL8_9LAMI|nr:caffeoylshikimate esterase [Phtheirospermum japonicum]
MALKSSELYKRHPFNEPKAKIVPAKNQRSVKVMGNHAKFEGVSEDLQNILDADMDQVWARRRARDAFKDIQLSIDHILFKTPTDGLKMTEILSQSYDVNSRGLEIFSKSWLPESSSIKAVICICHGIARKLANSGYGVFAMDYPGFGLSQGLHGFITNFDRVVDDVVEHYSKVKGCRSNQICMVGNAENPKFNKLPSFLFGQSMGGAVALKVHLKQPKSWSGAVLVAPMCKTKYNILGYKHKPRLATAVELLRTTKEIEQSLEKVSLPLLILHGKEDKVTDPSVSKALYEKASSQDKKLNLYDDAAHALLEGEPDEMVLRVFGDIISWLDAHCG